MKARRLCSDVLSILVVVLLSASVRLYFVDRWKVLPTSDAYFFVAWASGISRSSHLEFPGSDDSAYGDYPNGYAIFMEMLSSTSGVPLLSLAKFLPVLVGSLSALPIYLVFRRITPKPAYWVAGTVMVASSFTFVKYTSVSIPNMLGLYFFPLALWMALGRAWTSKRMLALLILIIPAVAKIHYLSLVCLGVALAIVVSRRLMMRVAGQELDLRRIAFVLIVALVAGVLAWTAAYRIMLSVYKIDITAQPPPTLSQATKLRGYPLIFGLVQSITLPVGLATLASIYFASNFGGKGQPPVDPLLLFVLWFAFLTFAAGFFPVEYYPFRFNSFLMLPMGMIGVLGLGQVEQSFKKHSATIKLAALVLPTAVVISSLQPIVQSAVPMLGGKHLSPWTQEYGALELAAMNWAKDNLLPTVDAAGPGKTPRRQMLMADWVRSRALGALGFSNVHLHWWFFQGVDVRTGKPYPLRSLAVYTGNTTDALLLLGRLNIRSTPGIEDAYYYKYIYVSDCIATLVRRDLRAEVDFRKFDEYDGRYLYFAPSGYSEFDYVRDYLPEGYKKRSTPGGDIIASLTRDLSYPLVGHDMTSYLDITVYRLRPFDRLYSMPGAAIYNRPPVKVP